MLQEEGLAGQRRLALLAVLRAYGVYDTAVLDVERVVEQLRKLAVKVRITVEKPGGSDHIELLCLPVRGDDSLAEKLGLVLTVGAYRCVILPGDG